MEKLTRVSGFFLAMFFLYTGFDKVLHYGGFVKAVASYAVIPAAWAPFLALPVILAEIAIGTALLLAPWRRGAALAAALLLAAFTVALVVNLRLGVKAPCGCWFTLSLGGNDFRHVFLNLILIGLALTLGFDSPRHVSPERAPQRPESRASAGTI